MAEVTVRIRKGEEIREKNMEFDDLDMIDFLFGDGTYGCDCNRGLFFDGGDHPCGGDIYAVEIIHDGEVIYSDF